MKIIKWNGKKIAMQGVYSGIPLATYHSAGICEGKAVSSSPIRKAWSQSMAHFFDTWCENPGAEPTEPTREMILGSAAHHLLLGEAAFASQYVARPLTYRDLKTAEEKKWHASAGPCVKWEALQAKAKKTVVTEDELNRIKGMARSLVLEPLVSAGILSGSVECSMFAKDPETGLWLKSRPDVIPGEGGDFVDLKTAGEITTVALQSAIRSRGYHIQGGLTWQVCELLGIPFETFILMFVESRRPFCVYPVPIDDRDLARGRLECRSVLRKIAGCLQTGVWPGPFDGHLRPLGISNDERDRIDARLKQDGLG
jgi:hypothetical protein